MNTINKAVHQFMDKHAHYYCNQHDVEFIMLDNTSICISGTWWIDETNDKHYIELVIECKLYEFVELFGINSLTQLKQITTGKLFEKFKSGHTEICCSIDEPMDLYLLSFQIKHNKLWATDDMNNSFKVEETLNSPDEFMNYTKQKCFEVQKVFIKH
jgi:hypothetical protein